MNWHNITYQTSTIIKQTNTYYIQQTIMNIMNRNKHMSNNQPEDILAQNCNCTCSFLSCLDMQNLGISGRKKWQNLWVCLGQSWLLSLQKGWDWMSNLSAHQSLQCNQNWHLQRLSSRFLCSISTNRGEWALFKNGFLSNKTSFFSEAGSGDKQELQLSHERTGKKV